MPVIVLMDGDEDTRPQLVAALKRSDFEPVEVADGLQAVGRVFALRPAAVVLDMQVAGLGGLDMLRVIRAATDVPIIVLNRVRAGVNASTVLDCGADDYVERPVDAEELVARVRSAVRRHGREREVAVEDAVVRSGGLVIDRSMKTVYKHGSAVRLTATEYRLLEAMALHGGQVASHRYLLSTVWGEEYVNDTHYLRVYVGYLRNKLEDNPVQPRYLLNEWGRGYRLALLPVECEAVQEPRAADARDNPRDTPALAVA